MARQTVVEGCPFERAYSDTAEVVDTGRALRLRKQHIVRYFDSDPSLACALMQFFARQIVAQCRRADLLSLHCAKDRFVAALAKEARTGMVMALAAHIGITHEATYHTLAKLVPNERVTKVGHGRYTGAEN